jgi:CheY-like chemotaxis protein
MKLRRTKQQEEPSREETQRKLEEKRKADEERKRQISEAVKRLEGHLKAGKVDLASLELEEVRKLDRRNPYIGAFEERIEQIRLEQKKKSLEEEKESILKPAGMPETKKHTPSSTTKPPQPARSAQPKILVIEDDPGTLLAIGHILTKHGYDVTSLETSDEALVLLTRWTPDLIISDINLSTSSIGGFTLYEEVRRLEHLDDVPFVVLTSHADEKLQRIGKEMGIDEYLPKPVHQENLVAAVRGKLKRFGARKKKG